ncbi:hypothetical protein D3C83_81120 [compost metagenome]
MSHQIVDRHVDRALRASVMQHGAGAALREFGTTQRILTDHKRREMGIDGRHHARQHVTGHERR